jgi:ribonuclease HI
LAEAMAVRRALAIAKERGFQYIILASDCLSLMQRIQAKAMDHSVVGVVVRDIKFLAKGLQIVFL